MEIKYLVDPEQLSEISWASAKVNFKTEWDGNACRNFRKRPLSLYYKILSIINRVIIIDNTLKNCIICSEWNVWPVNYLEIGFVICGCIIYLLLIMQVSNYYTNLIIQK